MTSNVIDFPYNSVSLNNQQYKLVTDNNNNCLILSCAGSGKTLIITSRICNMIVKLGISANQFIICTFNN